MVYKSIADYLEDNNRKDGLISNNLYSGPSPPPSPRDGDYWFSTVTNHLYVYAV